MSLKKKLIKLGENHQDLRENIKPVLDHIDKKPGQEKSSRNEELEDLIAESNTGVVYGGFRGAVMVELGRGTLQVNLDSDEQAQLKAVINNGGKLIKE